MSTQHDSMIQEEQKQVTLEAGHKKKDGKIFDQLLQQVTIAAESDLVIPIQAVITQEFEEIKKLRSQIESYKDTTEEEDLKTLDRRIDIQSRTLEMIIPMWPRPEKKAIHDLFGTFLDKLELILDEVEEQRYEIQDRERFYPMPGDRFSIRILKKAKRLLFNISRIPARIRNLFRKRKIEIVYWKHRINFRNLAFKHYRNGLLKKLEVLFDKSFREIGTLYLNLSTVEESFALMDKKLESISTKDLKSSIDRLKKQVAEEAIKIVNSCDTDLRADYKIAGTFELPNRRFSAGNLKKSLDSVSKTMEKQYFHWELSFFAIFEEWRGDIEVRRLSLQAQRELLALKIEKDKRLAARVHKHVDTINAFIAEQQSILQSKGNKEAHLRKVLDNTKTSLDKDLVPSLCNAVSGNTFVKLLNRIETANRHNIELLSEEHTICKTQYDGPVSPGELSSTSSYELVSFELLSKFEDSIDALKSELLQSLEKVNAIFKDIDHIIIFSVSSALTVMEEGKTEEESVILALEGISRSQTRLKEGLGDLEVALDETMEKLTGIIDKFSEDVLALTDNENVLNLKIRITKAKTLQQAEEVRDRIRKRILESRTRALDFLVSVWNRTKQRISKLRSRFILTAKEPELTRAVSDFLSESQGAMDLLPTIYRQLYKIDPLTDTELFEGRVEELEMLDNAFKNFEKGRYASTIIVGEKWGGQTTFLNYALATFQIRFSISRTTLPKAIGTPEALLHHLRSLIRKNDLDTMDDLIAELNEGRKRVIVIEDLQNLFVRRIGGFDVLESLFTIISKTGTNTMWISSTTLYSWNYLQKTVQIGDYFSYIIEMRDFSDELIRKIIWRRNSVSGFQIRFHPSARHLESKKFRKLDEESQQEQLENEFFKALCAFAKSNVSMALVFWLLSTKSVDSRTITIGTFNKPNLNFLGLLSSEKIQILHALVLHDGLNQDQLIEILNISPKSCRLILLTMVEDSIVNENEGLYTVNPLVYRDTVSFLKSKNFIQ